MRCVQSGAHTGLYSCLHAHILLSHEVLWKSVNSNSMRLRARGAGGKLLLQQRSGMMNPLVVLISELA